jgi:hypothetical protein
MGIVFIFLAGVLGLIVGEAFILVWFLVRLVDLRHGRTDFKISKKIPVFYLVYMGLMALFVFSLDKGIMVEGEIPFDTRLNTATRLFLLGNLSTPLYPLLAWLRHIKIESLKKATVNIPKEIR